MAKNKKEKIETVGFEEVLKREKSRCFDQRDHCYVQIDYSVVAQIHSAWTPTVKVFCTRCADVVKVE
jgi:hypothetical protein